MSLSFHSLSPSFQQFDALRCDDLSVLIMGGGGRWLQVTGNLRVPLTEATRKQICLPTHHQPSWNPNSNLGPPEEGDCSVALYHPQQ